MADLDVQRKSGMGWLWWVLGLILLALLLWWLFAAGDDDEAEMALEEPIAAPVVTPEPAAPVGATPAAVTAYLTQCTEEQGEPAQDMGLQHQFTINCLQQLREGMNALITQEQVANTDVSARFEEYSSSVQQLEASDPTNVNHANLTREAAGTAVEVMQAMETAWFAGNSQLQSAVGEVEQAAGGIQGNVQMLEQRESVHTFFREAGDALRMMAENRAVAAPAP